MCFKDLALGDVLQILNMLITHKKWVTHHPSGWQPLNITLPEINPTSGVVAGGQISPSGVVLETISPDGVVSKIIAAWGSFLRAWKTQTAIGNSDLVSVSNPPDAMAI